MSRQLGRLASALMVTALAVAIVGLLHPVLDGSSYIVLVTAVAIVSAAWGLTAASVSIVVAVLAVDFMFLAPTGSLTLVARVDAVLLVILGAASLVVAAVAEILRRRLARAEAQGTRAAALAQFFARTSNEVEREVEALHALRTQRDRK